MSSIEESSVRAVATSIGIKLASSTSDTFYGIPEGAGWANTLTESIIPNSSLVTRLIWNTLNTVEVSSAWASVADRGAAVGVVPGQT